MNAPCPDFDRLAVAAASGRPDDLHALDAHAAACAACAAEAALADAPLDPQLARALGSLHDVTCPPAVVDAALRQARPARRSSDRPARGAGRRLTPSWRLGASVLLALTVVVVVLRPDRVDLPAPDAPLVAEVRPPDASATRLESSPPVSHDPPVAEPTEPARTAGVGTDVAPGPPPRRPTRTRRPTPMAASAPTETQLAHHVREDVPDEPDPLASASEETDVYAAAEGLQLALAVVGDAREHARSATADGLRRPYVTLTTALLP